MVADKAFGNERGGVLDGLFQAKVFGFGAGLGLVACKTVPNPESIEHQSTSWMNQKPETPNNLSLQRRGAAEKTNEKLSMGLGKTF
jgi:hypothetical protein